MTMQLSAARWAIVLVTACAIPVFAQMTNNPAGPASAASAGSPGTIGAMRGVAPTPALGSSAAAPKLERHSPGSGTITQPGKGASSSSMSSGSRGGASWPADKASGT